MKVIRKTTVNVKHFKVGDQIQVGRYTATAVHKAEDGMVFCFDSVYGEVSLAHTKLEKKLQDIYKSKAFKEIRELLAPFTFTDAEGNKNEVFIRMPSVHELLNRNDAGEFEPSVFDKANAQWEPAREHPMVEVYGKYNVPEEYWVEAIPIHPGDICGDGYNHAITSASGTVYNAESAFVRPVFKLRDKD